MHNESGATQRNLLGPKSFQTGETRAAESYSDRRFLATRKGRSAQISLRWKSDPDFRTRNVALGNSVIR